MPLFTIRGPSGLCVSQTVSEDRVNLGRSVDNHIVLPSPTVSRRHAQILREGEGWSVVDLDSRHGTRVNGRRVKGRKPVRPGDEIGIGPAVVVLEGEGSGETLQERTVSRSTMGPEDAAVRPLVGASPAIRRLGSLIDKVAGAEDTVLLTGETGTGKNLVAALIHQRSHRASGPFVAVNCPALPGSLVEYELFGVEKRVATEVDARPGKLETAHGGTLLLDEVGELDRSVQAKLLHFLDDKTVERIGGRTSSRVDVRVLAATNRDLLAAVEEGSFRLDLYHRLNTVEVALPPLRERREDIPALVEHFLTLGPRPDLTVSPEALEKLSHHDFPGNVRELARIVARARLMTDGPVLLPESLPDLAGAPEGQGGARSPERAAEEMYERVVDGGESFWEVVHEPYLRRAVSGDAVRRMVARVYQTAGRSKREMARRFHITDFKEYRKLADFLRRHGLLREK